MKCEKCGYTLCCCQCGIEAPSLGGRVDPPVMCADIKKALQRFVDLEDHRKEYGNNTWNREQSDIALDDARNLLKKGS